MMSPSNSNETDVGEPSSYQHMEQTLAKVAGNLARDDALDGSTPASAAMSEPRSTAMDSGKPEPATPGNAVDDPRQSLESSRSSAKASSIPPMPQGSFLASGKDEKMGAVDSSQPSPQSNAAPLVASASNNSFASYVGDRVSSAIDGTASGPPKVIQTSTFESSGGDNVVAAVAAAAAASMASSAEGFSPTTLPVDTHASMQPSERSTKSKGSSLRRGKWTAEEEAYVARVIQDFNSGFLNAPAGTTLRSYLSDKLQCDPMRITKKFTGESCIGKRVFHPAVRSAANASTIDKAQAELDALEKRWRRRLEMQQRESAKKAAASAAAANAATRGSSAMVQGVPVAILGAGVHDANDSHIQQTAVTQAASWLDRANAILKGTIAAEAAMNNPRSNHSSTSSSPHPRDESTQSSGDDSLENQMKELQRLIYEGPAIQQTAAAFPNLLIQSSHSSDQGHGVVANNATLSGTASSADASGPMSPDLEPADKRLRTSGAPATSGAEDAEALIGFLSSVRASAAAGHDL